MQADKRAQERPDGILLVIAYFVLLGVGFVLGGITLLVTAVPQAWQMARSDSFFFGGLATLLLMTVALLLLGGWLLFTARNLWRARAGGRATAVVLAALLTLMCLLAIPSFFFAFGNDRTELLAGIGMALLVGLGSAASLWYLLRPSVKGYLG